MILKKQFKCNRDISRKWQLDIPCPKAAFVRKGALIFLPPLVRRRPLFGQSLHSFCLLLSEDSPCCGHGLYFFAFPLFVCHLHSVAHACHQIVECLFQGINPVIHCHHICLTWEHFFSQNTMNLRVTIETSIRKDRNCIIFIRCFPYC